MAENQLAKELLFKRDWIFDPPPELYKQFELRDMARLAVIQLRAGHAALKANEEAMEEAIELYSKYIK